MYVGLASLTDATIARLHADPPQVWQIVAPDDPDAVVRARGTPSRPDRTADTTPGRRTRLALGCSGVDQPRRPRRRRAWWNAGMDCW